MSLDHLPIFTNARRKYFLAVFFIHFVKFMANLWYLFWEKLTRIWLTGSKTFNHTKHVFTQDKKRNKKCWLSNKMHNLNLIFHFKYKFTFIWSLKTKPTWRIFHLFLKHDFLWIVQGASYTLYNLVKNTTKSLSKKKLGNVRNWK